VNASVRSTAAPVPLLWLIRHELRLSWRDWQAMVTAGNRRRFWVALVVLGCLGLALHLPAYAVVAGFARSDIGPDQRTLFTLSMVVLLYVSLLLSQAMETVTRSLYSRGDLELVLSSPVSARRLFSVRIFSNALLIALMGVILSAPLIDMLAIIGGPRWLAAYGVAVSVGLAAAGLAVAITIGLFRILGPRRTRLVAQVMAAVIGAAFAIGIQVSAILYYGNVSQRIFVAPDAVIARSPSGNSPVWWPARAILGDWLALAGVVAIAIAVLAAVMIIFAPRLGEDSIAATDLSPRASRRQSRPRGFRPGSPAAAMRRKEWLLLRRDPWLVSQTLTQLFYLIPPALLLMRNFGQSNGVLVVVVMVLVTVGGQLAGALAWLAISGEDAPDLVRTAPVAPVALSRAKVEAVMGAVAIMLGPLVVGLALLSPYHAVAAALGLACAAGSTIRIQLWFRAQAKRSLFRRRHTSSRIATFGEALVSFSWAAAAGLAAAGTWLAAISVAIALLILLGVRSVSPRKALV
jgi:ABC-2 type transport system permease protein